MNQTGSHVERFNIRTENFEKPVLILILHLVQLRSGSDFAFDSRVVLILRLTQVLVLILTATRVVGSTSH